MNAPMTFKYRMTKQNVVLALQSLRDSVEQFAKELVKYIRYYNNDRIKLRLKGKSPVQYRALFQSKSAS